MISLGLKQKQHSTANLIIFSSKHSLNLLNFVPVLALFPHLVQLLNQSVHFPANKKKIKKNTELKPGCYV